MKKIFLYIILLALIGINRGFADDYRVTYCSSMEKVFIDGDHGSTHGSSDWPLKLQAAQNEYEGFQIIVKAESKNLTHVNIMANNFKDKDGHILPADRFSIYPIGYVHIVNPSANLPDRYVGWWPDPILEFLSSIDVNKGKYQPFFVSVHVPKGQPPGVYMGSFTINVDNSTSKTIPAELCVWDFAVPDKPSLPAVMGLYTSCVSKIYGEHYDQALKEKLYNFLLDYKISPDNLYSGADYVDILARLKDTRWLGMVSLAHAPFIWESNFDQKFDSFLQKAAQRYSIFQNKQLLGNAYIYIFDEVGKEHKSKMQQYFGKIKQKFPDVPIMTTSVPIDEMNDFPNVDYVVAMYDSYFDTYQNTLIANARSHGKKVFWYVSNYPGELNFAIENPLLNIRILMGADAARYRPDGFLYWAISRWTIAPSTNTGPIQSGPLTHWDPQSMDNYNGCGSLFYPGPEGPIASLRLEAYRDGVEDYEYYVILEKLIEEKKDTAPADVLKDARAILNVSPNILGSTDPSSFVRSPQIYYYERERVAEAILALKGEEKIERPDLNPPSPPTGILVKEN